MKRFPYYRQLDTRDCGATCLQMIARYYGKRYSLQTLRELSYISKQGASLMGVSDAAEAIGFSTQGVCVTVERLYGQVPLPCILHWNQNHYVVLYKVKNGHNRRKFYIADPAKGKITMTEEDFCRRWLSTVREGEQRGIALALQPSVGFGMADDEHCDGRSRSLSRMAKYLRPYKWQFLQSAQGMVLLMVLGFMFPFLTQSLVDVGIRNHNLNFITLIVISQFVLALTNMGVSFVMGWISLHVNTRINISLISDYWVKLSHLPLKVFDSKNTGDLLQRMGDHQRIETFLANDLLNILFAGVNFVVYSILLAYYDVRILTIFIIGQTLYVAWIMLFLSFWRRLDYKKFDIDSKDSNCTLQLLQGMSEIKLNNDEHRKIWEWKDIQAKRFGYNVSGLKIGNLQTFGATLISRVTGIVITFIVARQVVDGTMTLGMMMAISYIIGQIEGPVSQFIGFAHSWQNARISLERLNEIHSQPDEEKPAQRSVPVPLNSDISFSNVSFSYSGSPREYVLKDVSLNIPYGKVTAIVGMSGSGKTTIMKLMLGFYKPQLGEIKVGNTALGLISPRLWREHVGSVMQDGYIFNDTIARNIAVGCDDIDAARLELAVKTANVRDLINKLPLGVNTKVGTDGTGLSQGQKQRILIARAVYRNPEFLMFDEATNSLDTRNERIIMENLNEFYQGRTVVICAHRLSTIKKADQILVVGNGRIVECGSHDELMKRRGEYFQLVENQMQRMED